MTEAADPQNPVPEATQSVVEPEAPEAPPTPPMPPEPAPEPVTKAPEPVVKALEVEDAEPAAGDQELEFDAAEVEFSGDPSVHPSKLPVAHRPAPAGPSSHPHPRVARAREENR